MGSNGPGSGYPSGSHTLDRRAFLKVGAGLGGLVFAGPLLAACGGTTPSASTGKNLTYAYAADVETLDPLMTTDTTTENVAYQMFDTLVRMGADGNWQGELAQSWENPDSRSWKFHLRQNVKFHNGEPFNAQTVKFSFDRILDPKLKSPAAPGMAPFDHVQVVDDATVVFVTKDPYAATLAQVYGLYIVPPQYIGQKGNDGFAANPVGTGPFTFVERQKAVHVKMQANANYWKGKPTVGTLTFRPIPEDASRIAALQNGEVDWIAAVNVDRVKDLKTNSKLQIQSRPGQGIYGGMDTLKFKPFMDKRVRQAMNYGINMDSIVKNLLDGLAIRLPSALFSDSPGFDPKMAPYPYDPNKAKQLLSDAGYPNGFEVEFDLPVGLQSTQKFDQVGQAMQQDLAKIGVKANIKVIDPGTAFDQYRAGKYQLFLYPWASNHEAGVYIQTLLESDTRGYYYKNPQADTLIRQYMSTIDATQRANVGKQMNQFFFDDCPWVYMYQEPDIYGYGSAINWKPNAYDAYFHAVDVKFQ